jgi:hypothetical protein
MSFPVENSIYGNQVVVNARGEIMFRCKNERADWYLSRNLAQRLNDTTVQLTFEPKGNGYAGDDFYTQQRENKCVVCGVTEELSKHHVVPQCYRTHFPEDVKASSSHDIVPLCLECHSIYEERYALELRQHLEKEYNAPVNGLTIPAMGQMKALAYYSDRIPPSRIQDLLSQVHRLFKPGMTLEEIKDFVLQVECFEQIQGKLHKTHGQCVAEQVDDIQSFAEMWRSHFVTSMSPKYLPKNWDICRPVQRKTSCFKDSTT